MRPGLGILAICLSILRQTPLAWLIFVLVHLAGGLKEVSLDCVVLEMRGALGDMQAQSEIARAHEFEAGEEVLSRPNRSGYLYFNGYKYNKALAARFMDLIRERLESSPSSSGHDDTVGGKHDKGCYRYLAFDLYLPAYWLACEGNVSALKMRAYMLSDKEFISYSSTQHRFGEEFADYFAKAMGTGGPRVELATCIILIARAEGANPDIGLIQAGYNLGSPETLQAYAKADAIEKSPKISAYWTDDYPWTDGKIWEAVWKSILVVLLSWLGMHAVAFQLNIFALLWANWMRFLVLPAMYLAAPFVYIAWFDIYFGIRFPSTIPWMQWIAGVHLLLIALLLYLTDNHLRDRLKSYKASEV